MNDGTNSTLYGVLNSPFKENYMIRPVDIYLSDNHILSTFPILLQIEDCTKFKVSIIIWILFFFSRFFAFHLYKMSESVLVSIFTYMMKKWGFFQNKSVIDTSNSILMITDKSWTSMIYICICINYFFYFVALNISFQTIIHAQRYMIQNILSKSLQNEHGLILIEIISWTNF